MLQYNFSLRKFPLIKYSFIILSTTPYTNPRLDSRIEPNFPIGGFPMKRVLTYYKIYCYKMVLSRSKLLIIKKSCILRANFKPHLSACILLPFLAICQTA